jgi:nicotinamidase/pyrazinamidase
MRSAVLVIDMLKGTFDENNNFPIRPAAEAIVPAVNALNREARARDWPVIFACDSFLKEDFIFTGKMKPHALRGTDEARVTDLLEQSPSDVFLPKRRFSAFFKTDLDQTLRAWGVGRVLVAGIATNICVLSTALDAICHDFHAVIVEDASASPKPEIHERTLANYRKGPLWPLLQVLAVEQALAAE